MSLSLENFIEKKIWDEWSERLRLLKTYNIRKKYYPNNLSFLEKLEKDIEIKRRTSIKYAISHREKMEMNYENLRSEEKELWQNKCKKIENINFMEYIFDNKVKEYFDEIEAFEYERLMILKDMTSKRFEEVRLREAAEALIMLHRKSHQEVEKDREQIQVIRRSSRLARNS